DHCGPHVSQWHLPRRTYSSFAFRSRKLRTITSRSSLIAVGIRHVLPQSLHTAFCKREHGSYRTMYSEKSYSRHGGALVNGTLNGIPLRNISALRTNHVGGFRHTTLRVLECRV